MYSFFPQTIRDWNDLPESLISSSELSDDSVSKFTSLVRARINFPQSQPLVKDCQFGVSPVNYSDSDSDSDSRWIISIGIPFYLHTMSFRHLDQEMGHEISTSQVQHDAADKKHNKIQASYTLEGTVLKNVESIKYLGVTITSDLKWNTHIRNQNTLLS